MDQLEQAVIENRQGINAILQAIQGQPQQPQNLAVAGQPGQPPMNPQAMQALGVLAQLAKGGGEPSPFQQMAQDKMLRGLDLQNELTSALIKRIALGKTVLPE